MKPAASASSRSSLPLKPAQTMEIEALSNLMIVSAIAVALYKEASSMTFVLPILPRAQGAFSETSMARWPSRSIWLNSPGEQP